MVWRPRQNQVVNCGYNITSRQKRNDYERVISIIIHTVGRYVWFVGVKVWTIMNSCTTGGICWMCGHPIAEEWRLDNNVKNLSYNEIMLDNLIDMHRTYESGDDSRTEIVFEEQMYTLIISYLNVLKNTFNHDHVWINMCIKH